MSLLCGILSGNLLFIQSNQSLHCSHFHYHLTECAGGLQWPLGDGRPMMRTVGYVVWPSMDVVPTAKHLGMTVP